MNSIDCARQAPAFDVLVYASEEKELVEAQALDAEFEREKQQRK